MDDFFLVCWKYLFGYFHIQIRLHLAFFKIWCIGIISVSSHIHILYLFHDLKIYCISNVISEWPSCPSDLAEIVLTIKTKPLDFLLQSHLHLTSNQFHPCKPSNFPSKAWSRHWFRQTYPILLSIHPTQQSINSQTPCSIFVLLISNQN